MELCERAAAIAMAFLIAIANSSVLAQDTCGSIGNNTEDQLSVRGDERFYLNIANPAPCTGNITSWRVCYYGPNNPNDVHSYWATYAVYRRMGSGEDEHYERVSEMFSAVRAQCDVNVGDILDGVIRGGFNCYTDFIDVGDSPLIVQAGDIIGACVFNPPGGERRQLDIVGGMDGLGESLFEDDLTCTVNEIPLSVQHSDLTRCDNRRLHIYANIEFPPTTTPMATPDNQAITVQGIGAGNIPTSNSSESRGSNTGVIVGTIIGLLLALLLLGVVIVVIVLFLVRRRQNSMPAKYSTKTETDGDIGLDNITYGTGENNNMLNNGKTLILEAGTYEVPVGSTGTSQAINIEPEYYELIESTYAVPNVYEYATLGPNDEKDASSEQYYSPLDETTISYAKLMEKNKQEDIYGNVEEYNQPATGESELYAQIKACGIKNISSNLIQINGHLGSGQFGSVERGLWKDGTRNIQVAVKLLKEEATEMDKVKFLQEAAIMAQFKHPNVVSLYGVVSKTKPLMLVVELIEKGNLREHLHTLRPDPGQLPIASITRLLLSFSQQVALGMHYLSAKRFVHRDLAARNILISKDNICKVADFGMSRDLADETYYVSQGGQVPVKWTAPEAIHYKKYSVSSDVWSYGCLLYEIWSLGYKPFEGTANAKVIRLVDSGQRLYPPPGCSRVIYELMIKCWNPVAASRPGFREIFLSLIDSTEKVLSIPPEALDTHYLAGILGSPLEAGENMYPDLHDKYLAESDYVNEIN